MQKDIRNRWTGRLHDYVSFSPGPRIVAEMVTTEVTLGTTQLDADVKLAAPFLQPESSTGGIEFNTDKFGIPARPPFGSALVTSQGAQWILMGADYSSSPLYQGTNEEALGDRALVSEAQFTTRWLWGREVRDTIIPNIAEPGSVPSGSTRTVERGSGDVGGSVSTQTDGNSTVPAFSKGAQGTDPPQGAAQRLLQAD